MRMTHKKVTRPALISTTIPEQSALPQHEKGSSLPPQHSLDDAAANALDLPLTGPPVALNQPKVSVDNSMTKVEFHALMEMMKALQQ
ncbi:hypothetical protein ACLOJK_030212 [Asimina triloba]